MPKPTHLGSENAISESFDEVAKRLTEQLGIVEDIRIPQGPDAHEVKSQVRSSQQGFIGYGDIKSGERVLLATSRLQDPSVIAAIAKGLEARGAKVDILNLHSGPLQDYTEREFNEIDEVRAIIRRVGWWQEPRRYDGLAQVEELAERYKYDVLIQGDPLTGGPVPPIDRHGTTYRYYSAIWNTREAFASPATFFPLELNKLINEKTWRLIWREGRGGKVKLTDPEGTDLEFTLHEDYYEGGWAAMGWRATPIYGHLFGHPPPPIVSRENATGVISGTTSHYNRPFPAIRVNLENGAATTIDGGGRYGEEWRRVQEETSRIQYPGFPRPGLFWFWEAAIGTNPKVHRLTKALMLSSGGTEYERSRSGVIHMGFGTLWRHSAEHWAIDNGFPYGHLHIHLLFPTYEITKNGKTWTVIENGHLSVLDDPEVREVARKYGDPDELLKEDWIPGIPGVNIPGNYGVYASDPAKWILDEIKLFPQGL